METYYYIALYAIVCVIAGIWSEYRYKKGIDEGNTLLSLSPIFRKNLEQVMWEEQVHGSRQMITLLLSKKIIRIDEETGIVYGIADSSYDVRNDEKAKEYLKNVKGYSV